MDSIVVKLERRCSKYKFVCVYTKSPGEVQRIEAYIKASSLDGEHLR